MEHLAVALLRHGNDDFVNMVLVNEVGQVFRLAKHGEAENLVALLLAIDNADEVIA